MRARKSNFILISQYLTRCPSSIHQSTPPVLTDLLGHLQWILNSSPRWPSVGLCLAPRCAGLVCGTVGPKAAPCCRMEAETFSTGHTCHAGAVKPQVLLHLALTVMAAFFPHHEKSSIPIIDSQTHLPHARPHPSLVKSILGNPSALAESASS